MKITLSVAGAALAFAFTASPASAQFADQRSFMHPLGVWSNDRVVAQRNAYPRRAIATFWYAEPEWRWPAAWGWVMHERDW